MCLQINLNEYWVAQRVSKQRIGLLILSEHHREPSNFLSWVTNSGGKFSVALTPVVAGFKAEDTVSGTEFAWLRYRSVIVFSCY